MNRNLLTIFSLCACLCLFSCNKKKEEGVVKILDPEPDVKIELVEIILPEDTRTDSLVLSELFKVNAIPVSSVYKWNNHWVLYKSFGSISKLAKDIQKGFPGSEIRMLFYNKPYYKFTRDLCSDKSPAESLTHIIMTADLVDDKAMQQEYMNYHATQFEEWPEVSKGFCNAGFQEVAMYRNGRQLMQVISIPKGKTLEELILKTRENNPRMAEWDKIMSKYQMRVPDADEEEIWTTFDNQLSVSSKQ